MLTRETIRSGQLTVREKLLVLKNLGLAFKEAGRVAWAITYHYHYRNCSPTTLRTVQGQYFDDLLGAAFLGLCVAAQRFDPERGSFSTCAFQWIRNRVNLAAQTVLLRYGPRGKGRLGYYRVKMFSEVARNNKMASWQEEGLCDVVDMHVEEDEGIIPQELLVLMGLILTDRELEAIRHFVFEDVTTKKAAEMMGVSKQRVSQLVESGLDRLRKSKGFMQALEKQMGHRRAMLNAQDFQGTCVFLPVC